MINRVRASYPDEKNYVDQRQKELQDLWNSLQVLDCYRWAKVIGGDCHIDLYKN